MVSYSWPAGRHAIAVALALGALLVPGLAAAQGFAIPWSSLDGGGHMRSTGATYSLGGTIGQPDAGVLNGGSFSVKGGFWGAPIPRLLGAGEPGRAIAPGRLTAAWPNPFLASTEVAFALSREGPARLDVFDLAGQRVRTLVAGTNLAGTYHVHWDGLNDGGARLAAGIYFLRLDAETRRTTQRVVMLQ